MRHKTLYIALGAVAIAAVIGTIVILQRQQTAQLTDETTAATVERGSLLVAVSASGTIEPRDRVSLTFEQPGLVDEVLVEVGDEVNKGDMLARLDNEYLALQARQAQASLTSAQAQLAQLKADARPEEVASAEANLRAVNAQVNSANAQLDRLRSGATGAEIAAAEAELASAMTEQIKAEDLHNRTMECFYVKIPHYYKGTIRPALGAPEEQARPRPDRWCLCNSGVS